MRTGTRAVWPVGAALAWLGSMVWVGSQIGIDGVGVGLVLSTVVTLPIVAVLLWLDRRRRERPRLLASAFAWGATIAAFCSIWSQQWLHSLVDATMGTQVGEWVRPLVITPVTEEVLKGLFLLWLLVHRRREITGVLDAVVLAGLAGAGFSFTENSLYFGRAVMDAAGAAASDDTAIITLGVLLLMRVGMVPFFHPLMVALTGIGVGIAASARRRAGAPVGPCPSSRACSWPSPCTVCGTGPVSRAPILISSSRSTAPCSCLSSSPSSSSPSCSGAARAGRSPRLRPNARRRSPCRWWPRPPAGGR
ncbi:Protease prsW family protein [Nonomuraea maritima]|uniref:Protease prsW family protein n=1 Tax=Nonomuraea maritima TaxID=683260 RepID=A0A1G9BDZ9_9ACTN|nr:PrsW family glutamic-type intramembrane protease [Nonomuraea maritima]SDK37697.1 Protease prsW family protein [Nonomuraea maritima]